MSAILENPKWDMTPVFPSLSSQEFLSGVAQLDEDLTAMEVLFDRIGVAARDPQPVSESVVRSFETIFASWDKLAANLREIYCYVMCHVTTDSRDNDAQARSSEMQARFVRVNLLDTRLEAWIGSIPLADLLASSQVARDHQYALEKMTIAASKQLSPGEEELAAKLRPTSSVAWGKLHGDISSQIEVVVDLPDGQKSIPMSAVRALAYDSDLTVRRTAYEAELKTWEANRVPLAASLNSIKGERLVLCELRGWESPLAETLLDANIDRETLDSMVSAAEDGFPDFRRYFRAKARATSGAAKLPFYDLFAPLGKERVWTYPEACAFVSKQFHRFSDRLGDYADRAIRENWIDVDPRPGKRDGAFCAGLRRDESRILLNFKPAFGSVSTLAHELGHGYHNLCLANRTMMQRDTPMTLAETASIFCETIITQAAIQEGDADDQLAILEASLMRCGQTVVDITSRYYFELAVFEQRKKRELSADEFCDLMKEAQERTYGDGMDPNCMHPYMWAAKPHYYGRSFYNFPYMYGLLFGVGLYKVFEQNPDEFRSKYDDLLSSTGLSDAWTLGQRFGIDVRDKAFWAGSLEVIVRDINRFEELISQTTKG